MLRFMMRINVPLFPLSRLVDSSALCITLHYLRPEMTVTMRCNYTG